MARPGRQDLVGPPFQKVSVAGWPPSPCDRDGGLARSSPGVPARCADDEFEAKLGFLCKEYRSDHVTLDLLRLAVDAFEEQKEEEERALFLKRQLQDA
jgi:hypothetical protein